MKRKPTVEKEFARYSFHGTNKRNAIKIQKEGFKKRTWFALHLEDAIEFGGNYVFMVGFDNGFSLYYWQFKTLEKIPIDRIVSLKKYTIEAIKGK